MGYIKIDDELDFTSSKPPNLGQKVSKKRVLVFLKGWPASKDDLPTLYMYTLYGFGELMVPAHPDRNFLPNMSAHYKITFYMFFSNLIIVIELPDGVCFPFCNVKVQN